MHSTIVKDLDKITLKIQEYLSEIDTIDQQNNKSDLTINATELIAKTNQLKDKKLQLEQEKAFLEQHNKKQYNKTDPDASLMQKPAHNLMAYNSQIVVDDKYKLIVATDITSCGTDINQLHKMAKQTKAILATDSLTIVADTGYDNH